MSAFDWVRRFAPGIAARYLEQQLHVAALERLYEAGKTTQYFKPQRTVHSADAVMDAANHTVRSHARYLDENHDLATGVLDCLVNNTVGTGIWPEPMLRRAGSDELHEQANAMVADAFRAWARHPDTTREFALPELQRQEARTLFRDGEVLVQHLEGGRFPHQGPVPYTVELLEPDYLPFELVRSNPTIVHGVEKGLGGRPEAYHILREHPGDVGLSTRLTFDTVRIPASRIDHLKFTRRLRQTRGISVFHSVIIRLQNAKDLEEYERIAANVAAAFTAFIKKGGDYSKPGTTVPARQMEMSPGMIFDNLLPGEEIGSIGTNRPNPNLPQHLHDQIRRVAAGTGTGASTISRNYNGTYSAQRQEMVESRVGYMRLHEYFVERSVRPKYERWLDMALLSGALTLPDGVDPASRYAFECTAPAMPWIDPAKEVKADAEAVAAGFESRHGVIRRRGGNPRRVDAELARDDFTPSTAAPAALDATELDESDENDDQENAA